MLIITVLLATAGQVLRMNKLLLSLRWRCAFIHVAPLALRDGPPAGRKCSVLQLTQT
jgi:hypothetical protein